MLKVSQEGYRSPMVGTILVNVNRQTAGKQLVDVVLDQSFMFVCATDGGQRILQ